MLVSSRTVLLFYPDTDTSGHEQLGFFPLLGFVALACLACANLRRAWPRHDQRTCRRVGWLTLPCLGAPLSCSLPQRHGTCQEGRHESARLIHLPETDMKSRRRAFTLIELLWRHVENVPIRS